MLDRVIDSIVNPAPPRFHGVMGVFYYVDDATNAVKTVREAGHRSVQVFSPVPHHEIEEALEQGPSLVRWVTFVGGTLGATGGFALCIWSIVTWPLVIGGKELTSIPPFVVIGYESMILIAGLANLLGMLALARLPQVRPAAPYDPRFQEDRIGIWVPCDPAATARVEQMLKGHGAEEVQVHA